MVDRMKKYLFEIILTALFIILTVFSGYTFWLIEFDQNPPVVYRNLPLPTDKTTYKIGEPIIVHTDACRYSDQPFDLFLEFQSETLISLPPTKRSGYKLGCFPINLTIINVPEDLAPGRYKLFGKEVYRVNSLQERTTTWETVEFEVIGDGDEH